MRHFGVLKPDTFVKVLNYTAIPAFLAYIFSMFIYPWASSSWSWSHVHSVWHNWQALNVGMLAFLSSTIAFNISRYNNYKQRQRDFIASRAFLSHALSQLTGYFKNSSLIVKEAWPKVKGRAFTTPLENKELVLPEDYKEIFSRCIQTADSDVGEHLASILTKLQVHHSRVSELIDEFGINSAAYLSSDNLVSYMFSLGELQALVNTSFKFARGEEKFKKRTLSLQDFTTAYLILDLDPEYYDDLLEFTQRYVERNSNNT
ncbi:hypothetical protein M3P05_20495, partial [Sansalvadorimonas sp. 2012CJ34-2]